MAESSFVALLNELCTMSNIAMPTADAQGVWRLGYQGCTVHLEYFPDHDMFFLYAQVGTAPQSNSCALLKYLLHANCLYQDTGGCVLGLDTNDRVILASYAKLTGCSSNTFQNIVSNFAVEAKKWTQNIARFSDTMEQSLESTEADMDVLRV